MPNRKLVYLTTRIDFGRYREDPKEVKQILDSGIDGLEWIEWLMNNSWNFRPHVNVTKYIEEKKQQYELLQPQRS